MPRKTLRAKVGESLNLTGEDMTVRLMLLRHHAERLVKVFLRQEPVVEPSKKLVPPGFVRKSPVIPKGDLTIDELEYLDREFQRLAEDAIAARIALHSLLTLRHLTKKKARS